MLPKGDLKMEMGMKSKLDMIKELMDQLQEEMQYGKSDFEDRLGRKKPDAAIEVMKVEGDSPELKKAEDMSGMDMDQDMEMGEDSDHPEMAMNGEEESPEDMLKKRLMKLRG